MKKWSFIIFCLFLFILCGLTTAYTACAMSFRDRFIPNTFINGIDVGQMDAENARKALTEGYSLKIELRDGDGMEAINGSELDYESRFEPDMPELLKMQKSIYWGISLFRPINLSVRTYPSVNEKKLTDAVNGLSCLNVTPEAPKDAYIIKGDSYKEGFKIIPEKEGTQLDSAKVMDVIVTAVKEGKTSVNLDSMKCYIEPAVRSEDELLQKKLEQMNAVCNNAITISIGTWLFEDKRVTGVGLTGADFFNWLIYENGSLSLDMEKVGMYVAELEEKYKTYGTEREFRTHGANVIKIGGTERDTFGFWLDRNKTAEILRNAILSGKQQIITPAWRIKGAVSNKENDIGNTYIEVSIDEQELWYMKDGICVLDIPVITGRNTDDERTQTGVYRVMEKKDGNLIFGWNGESIRTASGRQDSDFSNKDTYILSGGVRDVEVPAQAAEELFRLVPEDTPIVIY